MVVGRIQVANSAMNLSSILFWEVHWFNHEYNGNLPPVRVGT